LVTALVTHQRCSRVVGRISPAERIPVERTALAMVFAHIEAAHKLGGASTAVASRQN
jgi:hypothetical protein